MKNLFGFIAILLLSAGVFGQTGGWHIGGCEFEGLPLIERIPKDKDFDPNVQFPPSITYSFKAYGKTFMLSYDTSLDYKDWDEVIEERSIFLYRFDESGWVKASDTVKTDFVNTDTRAYDVTYQRTNDLDGLIEGIGRHDIRVHENGIVEIKFLNFYSKVQDDGYNYRWDVVLFVPNGDETYRTYKPNIQMKAVE